MLNSIISTGGTSTITITTLLICTFAALTLGVLVAAVYMFKNSYTKSFVVTLVLLPSIVSLVIMLVNGNLGTGVAVAGAFSLVRFRSAPGSAREIVGIFTAMAIGLACGTGYIAVALIFLVIVGGATMLLSAISFGDIHTSQKELKITIPETLDYNGIFDDLFEKYTLSNELTKVKTTNMGTLYELSYHITLKDSSNEKEMIDAIRCRNGNLNIICGRVSVGKDEL